MKKLLSLTLLCLFITASLAEAQSLRGLAQQVQRVAQQRQPVQSQQSAQQQQPAQPAPTQQGNMPEKADVSAFNITVPTNAELTHARNHVLLMGVTQYPEAAPSDDALALTKSLDLGNLNYAIKDMEGLKNALVDARFCREVDIHVMENPTADEAEAKLRKMLAPETGTVKTGDRVLIAFSGHGIALTDGTRTMDFLCFSDAKLTYNTDTRRYTPQGLISLATLEEWLDAKNPDGDNLVFIDACRNVPDLGDIRGAKGFGEGDFSDVQNRGFFRFSSCAPGEVSWEFDDKEHGIFTYFLIEGMKGKAVKDGGGVITLADLQEYVKNETTKFVKDNNKSPTQTPHAEGTSVAKRTAANVNFSFVPTAEEKRQAALNWLDAEMKNLEEYLTLEVKEQVQRERNRLNANFTQRGYQSVVIMLADLRMQIEKEYALWEWEELTPNPRLRQPNRNRLRVAGAIAGEIMNRAGVGYGGYVQMGTQLGAAALEQRDATILRHQQAQRERNKQVFQEQLGLYADEAGTALGFFRSQELRSAALDELTILIRPYQGRQVHTTWTREISNLRSRNNQKHVVTSEIIDLKQRIEDYIAEQEAQRLASETLRQSNATKLTELEEWLTEHQNQSQAYRNLTTRIASLRRSNDQGTDVASQIETLERDIERFIAAPNQPASQPRPPAQQRRGTFR